MSEKYLFNSGQILNFFVCVLGHGRLREVEMEGILKIKNHNETEEIFNYNELCRLTQISSKPWRVVRCTEEPHE